MRTRMLRCLFVALACAAVAGTARPVAAQEDIIHGLSAASLQNQATQVGTPFAENMQVFVFHLDLSGAAPGVAVTFTAPASGPSGTFATTGTNVVTVESGPTGIAMAPVLTANDEVGSFSVVASAPSANPNAFFFTNAADATTQAFSISTGDGSNQATGVNTAFAIQLSVAVFDGSGQLLPGIDVVFAAPPSGPGGTFPDGSTTTAVTGATGLATAPTFTANGEVGTYTVTATVDGSQTFDGNPLTASFALQNTLDDPTGVPVSVSAAAGNGQQAPVLTAFNTDLEVVVLDGSQAFVEGAEVVFAAPSDGPSGTFEGTGTSFTTTSGATGLAAAPTFTANEIAGSYSVSVTATKDGVTAATSFGLTNTGGQPAVEPPAFAKAFSPASILPGEVSRLTFTVDSTANSVEVADLAFSDTLPAGVTVTAAPDASTDCTGGVVTADPGSDAVTYAGGAVAAGASCTVAVDVTATASGEHVNTSGDLTSTAGTSGPATATLEVATITKLFAVEAATGTGQITGTIAGGGPACGVADAEALNVTAVTASGPDGIDLPHGLIRLVLDNCDPGAAVDVTLTLPSPPSERAGYWKFGPTPNEPDIVGWYEIPSTAANGNELTFTLVDGGLGDSDLAANGTIVDPGGPGQPEQSDSNGDDGTGPTTSMAPTTPTPTGVPTDPDDPIATTTTPPVAAGGSTDGSSDTGSLPATGTAAGTIATSAVVLLLAGGTLLAGLRRRHPTA